MFGDQPDLFASNYSASENTACHDYYNDLEKLRELTAEGFSAARNAEMDDTMNRNDIGQYVKKIVDAAETTESGFYRSKTQAQLAIRAAADNAACDRGDALVRLILESSQRVGREIHRLMGLLRFSPDSNGLWVAKCAPDNSILPVFAHYFTMRFGEASWAIVDEKRNLALARCMGETRIGPVSTFPFLADSVRIDKNPDQQKFFSDTKNNSADQSVDPWEELWKKYHKSVNIENRKNPALQIQLMPRRYWKYLPEIQ